MPRKDSFVIFLILSTRIAYRNSVMNLSRNGSKIDLTDINTRRKMGSIGLGFMYLVRVQNNNKKNHLTIYCYTWDTVQLIRGIRIRSYTAPGTRSQRFRWCAYTNKRMRKKTGRYIVQFLKGFVEELGEN